MTKLIMPELFDHPKFIALLIARFPDAKVYIMDESNVGLLHLEMAAFRVYAQQLVVASRFDTLAEVYGFLESIVNRNDLHPDVENAICVSFLENFDFHSSDNARRAKVLLPPKLASMAAALGIDK